MSSCSCHRIEQPMLAQGRLQSLALRMPVLCSHLLSSCPAACDWSGVALQLYGQVEEYMEHGHKRHRWVAGESVSARMHSLCQEWVPSGTSRWQRRVLVRKTSEVLALGVGIVLFIPVD